MIVQSVKFIVRLGFDFIVMDFKSIFFNEFNRLRSGWRFVICALSVFLAIPLLFAPVIKVLAVVPAESAPSDFVLYIIQFIVSLTAALFFGWLYGKIFEDLPFRALGAWFTRNWLKDLILGLIIGAVSISLAVLIVYLTGSLKFQFNSFQSTEAIRSTLLTTLVIFIFGAAFEEAFFRGYIFQTLSRAKLAWLAIILTSAFFASAHLNNPSANIISAANTALAGVWLGVAYLKTRNLWFPFGVHLTWNWFQGAIYGINVSGLEQLAPAPLLRPTDFGPTWLTGGFYGIEGGFACTIALVISTLLIYFLPFLKPTEEMLAFSSEEQTKVVKTENL